MEKPILIRNARICDIHSPFNKAVVDILIDGGRIVEMGSNIEPGEATIVERENLHLSPGWLDIGTQAGEPGFEHRETLETLSASAISGGYTALAIFPNTDPVVQRKADVDSLLKKSAALPVTIYPIGAMTKDATGIELTEFMDMADSGAIAFSNGNVAIDNPGLLGRALIYSASVQKPIINRPLLPKLNPFAQIHEGRVSVQSGLEGFPVEAETIALYQDLSMIKYAGGRLISHGISSAPSIELLKSGPKQFFTGVAVMNILFNEDSLLEFDTRFKVKPPLRSEEDRLAIIRGIKEGLISYVFSNHEPMEQEVKDVEFGLSAFGASTLDSAFAMANTALRNDLSIDHIVSLFGHGPRQALNIVSFSLKEGNPADLTLFDPDASRLYQITDIQSKSKSNPAIGKKLYGKIFGTIIGKTVNLID